MSSVLLRYRGVLVLLKLSRYLNSCSFSLIALGAHHIKNEKGTHMFSRDFLRRRGTSILALALVVTLTACESKMDKAIDQAKQQAATTGQPQQVVAVDKTGTTTTTVVQPPAKGQSAGAIATTTTPPPPSGPVPPPQDPKVMPLGGDPSEIQAENQARLRPEDLLQAAKHLRPAP